MRDPQHALMRMASAELDQSGHDPGGELLVCLAALPPGSPGHVGSLGMTRADLVDGQPLPVPDVDLAQRVELVRLERKNVGDDPSSLAGSTQRARVDGIQTLVAEGRRELQGLPPTNIVQGRVRVPLEPSLAIPVGLAVSYEDDRRRHAG